MADIYLEDFWVCVAIAASALLLFGFAAGFRRGMDYLFRDRSDG